MQICTLFPFAQSARPCLHKLSANTILCRITFPGVTILTTFSAYADDISIFVMNNAEIEEVGKEIRFYEIVTGARFNCDKSIGLIGTFSSYSFSWARKAVQGTWCLLQSQPPASWRRTAQRY